MSGIDFAYPYNTLPFSFHFNGSLTWHVWVITILALSFFLAVSTGAETCEVVLCSMAFACYRDVKR